MLTISFIVRRLKKLWALLPLLTAKRLLNLAAAFFYFLIRSPRTVKHPAMLAISLTNRCNYQCIMCLKSSTKDNASLLNYPTPNDIDFGQLSDLLRTHAEYLCIVYLHGGEPFVYNSILPLLDLLNELKIPYHIGTNGSQLTEEVIPRLVGSSCFSIGISIDAASPETYAFMRVGGELDVLSSNIKGLNELKKARRSARPVLSASMCTFSFNASEMAAVVRLCHRLKIPLLSIVEGWDYHTPQVREEHFVANNLELTRNSLQEARLVAKELGVQLNPSFFSLDEQSSSCTMRRNGTTAPRNCLNLYASAWILPNMDLLGCSNATQALGSLSEQSFEEIWNASDRGFFNSRKQLSEGRVPPACMKCIYSGSFFS